MILSVKNIKKNFGGVRALDGVSLAIGEGEICCLAGENGSGKSTLIKIIAGVYKPDSGEIVIRGKPFQRMRPIDAIESGIQVIYQELSLFPNLSVAENLALNILLEKKCRIVKWGEVNKIAQKALDRISCGIDPGRLVCELSVAEKQLVAISRALMQKAELIIMDEPTAALAGREVKALFSVTNRLKERGISTLFVSHKLDEVLRISEKITILRNGKKVAEDSAERFDQKSLAFYMTGRKLSEKNNQQKQKQNKTVKIAPSGVDSQNETCKVARLRVDRLCRKGSFKDISFDVFPGEVVGVTGLLGSGKTDLALSLFGLKPADSGTIYICGDEKRICDVNCAIKCGIAYVPEDRLTEGLFLEQSVERNITAGILKTIAGRLGLVRFQKSRSCVETWISDLQIKAASVHSEVSTLSGGNQQKVVLAKWLATGAEILILNGPTVGVDVGSKQDIHEKTKHLAEQGIGILIFSSDIPEIVHVCDRIFLMHRGSFIREIQREDCDVNTLRGRMNELV